MSDANNGDYAKKLIPPALMKKIREAGESAQKTYRDEVLRYRGMSDDELLDTTRNVMRNLAEVGDGHDRTLRAVLVPECWERIRPGTRDEIRAITTSLADWQDEATSNLTLAIRINLGPEMADKIREESRRLRQSIEEAARADALWIIEQTLCAINEPRAYEGGNRPIKWSAHEPAFAYQLVPEIARRMLERDGRR